MQAGLRSQHWHQFTTTILTRWRPDLDGRNASVATTSWRCPCATA